MTRFHLHLNVADLATSLRFYTGLFGAAPTVVRHDYAKWMLDDPRINFAISSLGRAPGIDHVGFQVDSADGLAAIGQRLAAAEASVLPEAGAVCCYARSDKLWTEDPQGVRWESFHTTGEATTYYGADAGESACGIGAACAPDRSHVETPRAVAAPVAAEVVSVAAAVATAAAVPVPSSAAAKAACCGATSACC